VRDEKEIDKILRQEGVDMTPFEWVSHRVLSADYWLGTGDPDLPLPEDGVSLGVESGELENIHMKNKGLFAINVDPLRCKHLRKQCGLKQTEAAKAIGINITYMSQFENGKRKIEKTVLTKMAEVYGVEESKLKYTSSGVDPILDQPRTINGTPLSQLPKHSRAIRVDSKYREDLMRGLEYMVGKDKAEPVLALCRTIIFAEKGRM
jgi:transcriptional regulator with XRE-family HTH domain